MATKNSSRNSKPYDAAYNNLFSNPRIVQDLLVHYVKEPWINELDFNKMENLTSKLVNKKLVRRDGDLFWKISWGNRDLYLILMIEFQSSIDKYMSLRVANYVSMFLLNLVKTERLQGFLPPVVPIVIYNGDPAWSAPKDSIELFDRTCPLTLLELQPKIKYWCMDERRVNLPDEPLNLQDLLRPLLVLEQTTAPKLLLERCLAVYRLLGENAEFREIRDSYVQYVNKCLDFVPNNSPDVTNYIDEGIMGLRKRMEDWVEHSNQLFKEEGIKEGIKEGEEKGIQKEKTAIVLELKAEGFDVAKIAKIVRISVHEVLEILNSKNT